MAGRGERCLGCDPLQLSPLDPCKIITHVPSARRITLTIQLPSGATYGAWLAADWRRLLDLARTAEDAGADRLVVVDHVLMGTHADEQYHWSKRPFPPPDTPFLEPLSSLGAVAAVTHRVRLSTRILIAPLRPAALLAKSVATLDVLSGGRMELGVGVGWQREEYDAQGLDWSKRGELLTDTMGACRALWSGSPCSFRSASVTFEDVYCAPRPIQSRLPVWFGGVLHSKNLARLADLGDGWIPIMTARLEDVRQGAESPATRRQRRRPRLICRCKHRSPCCAVRTASRTSGGRWPRCRRLSRRGPPMSSLAWPSCHPTPSGPGRSWSS